MKITLSQIEKEGSEKDLLKIKKFLYVKKQEGILFYSENIFELSVEQPFQLYFSNYSSKKSYQNAFPISIFEFEAFQNKDDQLNYLKKYFESYYKKSKINPMDFLKYELENPFIGHKFVWYFRKLSNFNKEIVN